MAKKTNSLRSELRRLLKSYPDTAFMEILVPDALGVLIGKRIRAKDFEKYCDDPFPFCGGAVLLTVLGEVDEGLPGYDATVGFPRESRTSLPRTPAIVAPPPWPTMRFLFRRN